MNYKVEKLFLVTGNKTVKANGVLMLEDLVAVHFTIMDGKNGPFVSWKGTEKYTKKDGTTGYASPVILKKEFDDEVKAAIVTKFRGMSGAPAAASKPVETSTDFTSDDIPF